jgi:hypothetical protein
MLRGIGFASLVLVFAGSCVSCTSDAGSGGEPTEITDTPAAPVTTAQAPSSGPEITAPAGLVEDRASGLLFTANAFPPTISDTTWHRDASYDSRCLRCHETGVADAPELKHEGLPAVLLTAACRSCHVRIPGSQPPPAQATQEGPVPFLATAFPPMIPSSASHRHTWTRDDCLMCHESGTNRAPLVRHEGLPRLLLTAKCRTCHVQVRAMVSSVPP